MAHDRVVTGIDIGSSKICCVIASLPEDGRVSVIGVSSTPSNGIKKGIVVDIDEAVSSIADALERAQRMAGYGVGSASISCNGTHISSSNSHGVVAISNPDKEVSDEHVARVIEAARAVSLPSSREIIHVLPRGFTVDSQEGIKDPAGMSGIRLEVETNIISGETSALKNLVRCVQQVGVEVSEVVFTGLASAEAVLNDTEKELGTVLLDIGGGTTSLIVYESGSPVYSSVLPLGGRSITSDLAIGLRTSLELAEQVKISLSSLVDTNSKDSDSLLDFKSLGLDIDNEGVSQKLLFDIVQARLREIFTLVALELKRAGYREKLPAGIVLCGGGSRTLGIEDAVKSCLKGPVRIARPKGLTGLVEELGSPEYACVVGLINQASHPSHKKKRPTMISGSKLKKIVSSIISFFKSLLP